MIPKPLKIGVGGPVGSGKTALVGWLCRADAGPWQLAVITNDIYTREDAEFLTRRGVLAADRIIGVETGGCPHTAIREDASVNLEAVRDADRAAFRDLDILIIESGGDNLAATFSPELVDATIYVIDVAEGDKIPRKGGPGIMRSGLLVINKIDLAPYVGADLAVMEHDARRAAETVRLSSPISEKEPESSRSSNGSSANCFLQLERVGRDGFLDLAFERSGARTILARRRFTHPLQALAPVRAPDGSLCLMMLNPSGGLVGGDPLTHRG